MCDQKPYFKYIFGVNLSVPSDPDFKVAQILDTGNCLLFDLRQTTKGKKTKTGVCIQTPEYLWLKRSMLSNFQNCTLEHNFRIINLEKGQDSFIISVTKSNGITNKLALTKDELSALNLEMFETKIHNLSTEFNYENDFKPYSYLRETNQ